MNASFPARRIMTTAEPFAHVEPVSGTPARVIWTVYREPWRYCAAPPALVYRTPHRDTAEALAVELNRDVSGTVHYFYHRCDI